MGIDRIGDTDVVRYVPVVIAVLGALALSVFGGYEYRNAQCERDTEIALRETSDALAVLARQYAAADSAYRKEKERRVLAASQGKLNAEEALRLLTTRGGGWTTDERDVLHQNYCAAFGDAPACTLPK